MILETGDCDDENMGSPVMAQHSSQPHPLPRTVWTHSDCPHPAQSPHGPAAVWSLECSGDGQLITVRCVHVDSVHMTELAPC